MAVELPAIPLNVVTPGLAVDSHREDGKRHLGKAIEHLRAANGTAQSPEMRGVETALMYAGMAYSALEQPEDERPAFGANFW